MMDEESVRYTSFDCAGMAGMLAAAPLVLAYVFIQPPKSVLAMGGLGVFLVFLVVFALHHFTRWDFIGRVIDMLGCVLTIIYVAVAIWMWRQPLDSLHWQPQQDQRADTVEGN